ncbi:MAG: GGDEF domain-containing protein [Deltaproteobacteria bacterium]|nr:GGDEF domain-containing protein [Deltaproteobacteria bacterium]
MIISSSSHTRSAHSPEGTAEIARRVLLTMSHQKIPVTPENYLVWFEYTIGSNEELNQELDRYMAEGTGIDDLPSRHIYDKYFGEDKSRKVIEEISQATCRILKEALESAMATGSLTQDFSQRLNGFADRLEMGNPDPHVLKEMIKEVILDTKKMEQSSSELNQKLEKARQEANELRKKLEQSEREAKLDLLTGLYNRKYLDKALQALLGQYRETSVPFSIIMMDIDHFKVINDAHGHMVGDSILRLIGKIIKGAVKGRDVAARYGGEEFMVLLPATKLGDACKLAEGIREQISGKSLKVTETQKRIGIVTVSCGVGEVRDDDTIDCLVERADRALYRAKGSGRDNVKSENDLLLVSSEKEVLGKTQ